eukprot:SAG31_NODE_1450_length_8307_cov_3.676657_5_plen_58_part_00
MAIRDAHLSSEIFTQRWQRLSSDERKQVENMLSSMADWNFGHSDFGMEGPPHCVQRH